MHETHRTAIQMRFADTDALGHVNNASFASYVEVARLEFLARLGASVRSLILASLYIDYRRQIAVGDAIHVDTWIDRLGTSSIAIGHVVYANGERAADVTSVVVYFDYAESKSRALSSEMRAALAPYTVQP